MYPFYEKPPTTYKDVYDYITSWLQPVPEGTKVMYDSRSYVQLSGFRRASVIHEVLFDPEDETYIFVIVDDNGNMHPMSEKCDSFDKMIDSTVRKYCTLWRIDV